VERIDTMTVNLHDRISRAVIQTFPMFSRHLSVSINSPANDGPAEAVLAWPSPGMVSRCSAQPVRQAVRTASCSASCPSALDSCFAPAMAPRSMRGRRPPGWKREHGGYHAGPSCRHDKGAFMGLTPIASASIRAATCGTRAARGNGGQAATHGKSRGFRIPGISEAGEAARRLDGLAGPSSHLFLSGTIRRSARAPAFPPRR